MIDPDASMVITAELGPRESLLWSGRPTRGIQFRGSDVFLIPFSLLWCGFAIFWESSVVTTNAPFFFKLWGVPFVLMGLYFVFGRFIVDSMQRGKTFYGVTNERIIIVSRFLQRKTKSLNLRTLTDISLTEKSDGTGSIAFGAASPFYSWLGGAYWPGMGRQSVPVFDMVDNVKMVYGIIIDVQKAALQTNSRVPTQ